MGPESCPQAAHYSYQRGQSAIDDAKWPLRTALPIPSNTDKLAWVFYHFSLCQQTKRQGFAWQVIKKSYPGEGLSFSMAMGIDPEGTFRRMQLSLQIDDQLSASRFPVVLSPADIAEEALEYYPLLTLAVISQLASCSLAWLAARPSTPDFFPDFQDPADLTE
ncbi:hypothetical protein WJX79_005046 [Trebouxia sp. C0005]